MAKKGGPTLAEAKAIERKRLEAKRDYYLEIRKREWKADDIESNIGKIGSNIDGWQVMEAVQNRYPELGVTDEDIKSLARNAGVTWKKSEYTPRQREIDDVFVMDAKSREDKYGDVFLNDVIKGVNLRWKHNEGKSIVDDGSFKDEMKNNNLYRKMDFNSLDQELRSAKFTSKDRRVELYGTEDYNEIAKKVEAKWDAKTNQKDVKIAEPVNVDTIPVVKGIPKDDMKFMYNALREQEKKTGVNSIDENTDWAGLSKVLARNSNPTSPATQKAITKAVDNGILPKKPTTIPAPTQATTQIAPAPSATTEALMRAGKDASGNSIAKTPAKSMVAALSNIKPTQNDIPRDEYRRLGETVSSLSPEALKSLVATLPNGKKYLDKKGEPNIGAIQKGVSDGVVGPLTNAVYSLSKNLGNIPYQKLDASAQGAINSYNVLVGLSPTYPVNGTPPAFNPTDLDFKNQLAYDYQANAPAAVPPASVPAGNGATNVPPPVVPKTNYDGILSDATSGLRALGAAYLAKDGLPSWRPTDDYYKNYGDLKTRSNMGLSSEAKTYAEGMRNRAFSAGASQIGSIAGGGSSAAALGALSGLNESRFDSVNRSMLMDEAQRTLNQDKFTQAVGQDQNIDRMMYGDAYNQDMYKQQAANAAIAANLQNIEDRKDYEKTFGQGSNYEKMMNLKVEQSQLSNLAYRKFLQNQGLGGS